MPEVQGLSDEDKIKAIFYGNPKQGKTIAAAKGAHCGKVIAIDTEGMGWLKRPMIKHGIPTDNIQKLTATSYDEMVENYWHIQSMFNDPDTVDPFAVVIDHMTDLENRFLRAETLRRTSKLRRPLEAKVAAGGPGAELAAAALQDINPWDTDWDDYGTWTNMAYHLVRMYRDLPCHVVFIAHMRESKKGGIRQPGVTEKFRQDFMGTMNLVLGFTKMQAGGKDAYVAYASELDGWYGGDRFDMLKPIMVNPSLDRLVAVLDYKLDLDTDPEQQAFKQALASAK